MLMLKTQTIIHVTTNNFNTNTKTSSGKTKRPEYTNAMTNRPTENSETCGSVAEEVTRPVVLSNPGIRVHLDYL